MESESDTSTIIDEDLPVPDHPDADVVDESSEEVVCLRNSLDYNPAFYNQQSKSGDGEESEDNSDIHHQISVLKIRIHGIIISYTS